jgi:Cell wall-active antibiotics response 4TMS YvqF
VAQASLGPRSALFLTGLILLASPLAGQTMRSTTVSRQRHGIEDLNARIEFAAGSLTLRAGRSPALYTMNLQYDTERFAPLSRFDSRTGAVTLGVQNIGSAGLRVSSRRHLEQNAVIELSPDVDLSLDVALGAVEAGLDLGGLRLTDGHIRSTASKSTIRFSRPNPVTCSSLELNAGAADFEALALGNSGCREIRFDGGVGEVTLDLTGQWSADARLVANVAVGGITLRLPRQVGVELSVDRFLATFNPAGFTRRGSGYFSEGFDAKERHLKIDIKTTVGDINVEWVN